MAYPDLLQNPSRTIITAEVGSSVSRTRHVVEHKKNSYRRLMPLELERLNGFPENWTELEKISDSRRGFLMGNALVVGLVERLGKPIEGLLGESQGE
jgi:DNA (cytosine-5)-methyltransferase 1